MDEILGSVDAPVIGDGKTSDQILAEIEAAKSRELETESAKAPVEPVRSEDAPDNQKSGKQSQTAQVSEGADDEPAPQGESPTGQGKAVDVNEWMKKKGFRSVEDMAKSLRSLEQELSRRPGRALDETSPMQPEATIQTQAPQVRYAPPQTSVEELAKRYNLPPEDFERVMPLINDATDLKMRMAITPLANEINRLNSELRKKASSDELERDPTFKNRVVMQEMYQIMESDPSVQRAPDPLKVAHEKALLNMGRRFAEGLETQETDQEQRSEVPTTPPPLGKSGQGTPKGSHMKTLIGKMTPEKFNSLSSAEMEKYLASQGKVRHETF